MKEQIKIPDCKNFTGYKPCFPEHNCLANGCKENIPVGTKILIINLDAMGDVLMTTAQLPALKRKFPESSIYWITLKNAAPILANNKYVDKVYEYNFESVSILNHMKFDYVLNADKSQRSCALINAVNSKQKLGFGLNENGVIIPLNKGAYYNYNLGMDDNLKFKLNKRKGQDYLAETFNLDYKRDEYVFELDENEKKFVKEYKKQLGLNESDKVVGFNTGCSNSYPNKKMTIEQHIYLIEKLLIKKIYKVALFGGPEDKERNEMISQRFDKRIINTPVTEGVRKGACYESIADVVITGDSFGMHLGIALKKYLIVWFGVSCWNEIDLYNRGIKLYQKDLFCSPCWKMECPYNLECIQQIDLNRILEETENYFNKIN